MGKSDQLLSARFGWEDAIPKQQDDMQMLLAKYSCLRFVHKARLPVTHSAHYFRCRHMLLACRCKRKGSRKHNSMAVSAKLYRPQTQHQQQRLKHCLPIAEKLMQALTGISRRPIPSRHKLTQLRSVRRKTRPLMIAKPRTTPCFLPLVQTCCQRLPMPSPHLRSAVQSLAQARRIQSWSQQGPATGTATEACQHGAGCAPRPGTL